MRDFHPLPFSPVLRREPSGDLTLTQVVGESKEYERSPVFPEKVATLRPLIQCRILNVRMGSDAGCSIVMTDAQILTIALATVPTMITVLIGILINNSRMGDLRSYIDVRFNDVDRRLDEMKDMWRSELHRVEEVLDARLKHLEER